MAKLFLLFLSFCFSLAARPILDAKKFEKSFTSFLDHEQSSEFETTRHRAKRIHYVFVAGFLNEKNPVYFADNAKQLTWRHLPYTLIEPPSSGSIDDNVAPIFGQLKNISGRLVVIGHSKGAVELLATAIKHADWFQKKVEAVILIQGAFGGSAVADYVQRKFSDISKLNDEDQLFFEGLREVESFIRPFINRGLKSLSTEISRNYWKNILQTEKNSIERLSDKIFYVRSAKRASDSSDVIAPTNRLISHYGSSEKYTWNDGLVTLPDQKVEGIGTDLLYWVPDGKERRGADHADLVVARALFTIREPENLRASFMKAIIQQIEMLD